MPRNSTPEKKQKKKGTATRKSPRKVTAKKALLIQCHSSTDEDESQSLLLTQPQGPQQPHSLAGALPDDVDGHGGEGDEASKPQQQQEGQTQENTYTDEVHSV